MIKNKRHPVNDKEYMMMIFCIFQQIPTKEEFDTIMNEFQMCYDDSPVKARKAYKSFKEHLRTLSYRLISSLLEEKQESE